MSENAFRDEPAEDYPGWFAWNLTGAVIEILRWLGVQHFNGTIRKLTQRNQTTR